MTATDLEIGGVGVRGGRVQLSHDPGTGRFRAVAEYESPVPLGDAGLELLKARTFGDWHDGVGGSFFERLGESLGVDVTVSVVGELEAEQRPVASAQLGPWSELVTACWWRQSDRVRELLDVGADVNARADGLPVLHGMITEGAGDIAVLLIERGADVHACDRLEPRHDALRACATSVRLPDSAAADIARALLERGADPDRGGNPPLAVARRRGRARLAAVLAAAGT